MLAEIVCCALPVVGSTQQVAPLIGRLWMHYIDHSLLHPSYDYPCSSPSLSSAWSEVDHLADPLNLASASSSILMRV